MRQTVQKPSSIRKETELRMGSAKRGKALLVRGSCWDQLNGANTSLLLLCSRHVALSIYIALVGNYTDHVKKFQHNLH